MGEEGAEGRAVSRDGEVEGREGNDGVKFASRKKIEETKRRLEMRKVKYEQLLL